MLKMIPPVPAEVVLHDGDEVAGLPGVQAVETPGHIQGYINLYVPESKTFIAADAVVAANEQLGIGNPQFMPDMQAALASVKKMAALSIEKLICYHGGVIEHNIPQQLKRLIAQYE